MISEIIENLQTVIPILIQALTDPEYIKDVLEVYKDVIETHSGDPITLIVYLFFGTILGSIIPLMVFLSAILGPIVKIL